MQEPLLVVAVLCVLVAVSEWLARRTWLRHLGSALLVIVATAVVANLGVVPTYGDGHPVYDLVFAEVAPLGIFWLLLQVDLRRVLRSGLPLLGLFLLGAVGTVLGVLAGMFAVGGEAAFGEHHAALAGMFVGTYTGGSVNFNAIALEYGVVRDGTLYAGAAAVDNAATTVWMAATVAIPRLWGAVRGPSPAVGSVEQEVAAEAASHDRETLDPLDLGVTLALGLAALWSSRALAAWLAGVGLELPDTLVLTTLALVLAQVPAVRRRAGARVLGMFAVLVFLAVIGALCDVAAVADIGALAGWLTLFVGITVLVHGGVVFGATRVLRLDPAAAAIASQANVGGATSALALARSLGRDDLVVPAVLVGSLGLAVGNYLGFATVGVLG